jgi:hypothetical protein
MTEKERKTKGKDKQGKTMCRSNGCDSSDFAKQISH